MQKLSKLTAALVLAAAVAAPALAAPETFVIDGTHTFPRFSYNHFGYSTQLSRFDKTSGKVVFDKVAKTGSVDIVIDTKSVNTGYTTFNDHIQGEDFLDTAKFPTATFKSTKVIFEGDKLARVEAPVLPTNSEFIDSIDPFRVRREVPTLALTSSRRSQVMG